MEKLTTRLSQEQFYKLFEHLPLNDTEKESVKNDYWNIYKAFVKNDVSSESAWLATRNIFAIKESQISDRIKSMKTK